jgi:hypothetical protein
MAARSATPQRISPTGRDIVVGVHSSPIDADCRPIVPAPSESSISKMTAPFGAFPALLACEVAPEAGEQQRVARHPQRVEEARGKLNRMPFIDACRALSEENVTGSTEFWPAARSSHDESFDRC